MDDLATAKKNLFDSLGDECKSKYLDLMKQWFRAALTKDEFDFEALKFLQPAQLTLHNQFLVSLFAKCQSLAGPKPEAKAGTETKSKAPKSKKKKAKVAKVSHEHRFIPVNPSNYIQTPLKAVTEPDFQPTLIKLTFCSGEGSLPDNFAAHLRMFVCVWESGLDSMADDAVKLLNLAIRDFVKNILTSVLTFKSTYKTRDNGRFKYAIGAPTVNPFLRNSHPLTKYLQDPFSTDTNENGEQAPDIPLPRDLAEHEAMFEVACSSGKRKENFESCETPVNLWHLFHALRTYKSCISSQTVYSVNMERIMMRLSHEDLN